MTRAQRKRRAVIGAIALLEWRDRMAREDADREMVRAKYEEMVRARYDLMVAEMRTLADEFWKPRAASHPLQADQRHGSQQRRCWRSVVGPIASKVI